MGLIKNNGRNVSVSSVNGYSVKKVLKAKEYLKEIGENRRNFPVERLVEMYNDIKGTREKAVGCKPCQANKYYMGLQNYVTYGEMTLINNGIATKDDLNLELQEQASNSGLTSVGELKEEIKAIEDEIKPKKAGRPKKDVKD